MPVSSREILRVLQQAGFQQVRQTGSHVRLFHPEKRQLVSVPHPKKDMPLGTIKSIERQNGLRLVKRGRR